LAGWRQRGTTGHPAEPGSALVSADMVDADKQTAVRSRGIPLLRTRHERCGDRTAPTRLAVGRCALGQGYVHRRGHPFPGWPSRSWRTPPLWGGPRGDTGAKRVIPCRSTEFLSLCSPVVHGLFDTSHPCTLPSGAARDIPMEQEAVSGADCLFLPPTACRSTRVCCDSAGRNRSLMAATSTV
jgi:hypothetical protein